MCPLQDISLENIETKIGQHINWQSVSVPELDHLDAYVPYTTEAVAPVPVPVRVAAGGYPWDGLTTADIERVFHSEAWAGTLIPSEFARVLDKLGLDGKGIGNKLFHAFDLDNSGHLDFKEVFIGMALLLSSSREQRLECAFHMMDTDQSGQVSVAEMEVCVRTIAPPTVSSEVIRPLSAKIMEEADVNNNGSISFHEFMHWPGKNEVLNWLDMFHDRILSRWGDGGAYVAPPPVPVPVRVAAGGYPWDGLTTADIERVFHSEAWAGTLIPSEFARVLDKLGLDGKGIGNKLFHAFDLDNSGHLDFKEVFIGMALLLSSSREQQLQSTFDMMDDNGSGRVSQQEISKFLRYICPPQATR